MSARAFRRAAIIAVGSELLTPTKLDTNSLHITGALNAIGVDVVFKAIVGDDRLELAALVDQALARVDLLVLTGGLGPTEDDVTREVVAAQLGRPLAEDLAITEAIRRRFASRGWAMPEINRRQAMVPEGAVVLANANGTAPGLWIEHDGRGVLLVPGPPREMQPMLAYVIAEYLSGRTGGVRVQRRVLKIAGRSESRVEELTQPVYSQWRTQEPPIETTILATPGQIELHLSVRGSDDAELTRALDAATSAIQGVIPHDIFSTDGRTLEEVVGDLLKARTWRIALAESCTGGLATSRLTDVSGSSAYVERSVVVYSNAAKVELLGVPASLLDAHGAVSEPVAEAMAKGVRRLAGADAAIAITGIAGPTGGSDAKPVGTVCIAVCAGDQATLRTFRFPGNRELVKTFSVSTALDMLRRMLIAAPANPDWLRVDPEEMNRAGERST